MDRIVFCYIICTLVILPGYIYANYNDSNEPSQQIIFDADENMNRLKKIENEILMKNDSENKQIIPKINKPCIECWVKYNDQIFKCTRPVFGLMDQTDLCLWKNQTVLTEDMMMCLYFYANTGSLDDHIVGKICPLLESLSRCMDAVFLIPKCNCKGFPLWDVMHVVNGRCKAREVQQQIFDCLDRRHTKIQDMSTLFFTAMPTCGFLQGEMLSLEAMRLNVLSSWMDFSPDQPHGLVDLRTGEISARIYCQAVQLAACTHRRLHQITCPLMNYVNMSDVLEQVYGATVNIICSTLARCEEFTQLYCKLQPAEFSVDLTYNINDISVYYNRSNYMEFTLKICCFNRLRAFITHSAS